MNKLGANWFAEGLTDFEYKKYILLAYLQHVHKTFEENRLYPELGDLVQHYRSLQQFLENKNMLYNGFPTHITSIDLKELKLVYEKTIKDDELMAEVERIVEYSLPRLKMGVEDGRHRYDDIEQQLIFEPVGILPLYKDEGYLLLKNGPHTETKVYQYRITIFEGAEERYRGLHTTQIAAYPPKLVYTYESIKKELVKQHKELPNPATYVAESEDYFPLEETLLPIAGRHLVKVISKGA